MSRPPNYEFQEWWNKQRANDHADDDPLSSSTSDDFRLLTVNIHSPTSSVDAAAAEKDISRSARQLSWIYFLKLHQIAHMLGFITNGFVSLIRTANRRISTASGGRRSESKFYKIIKFFLVLSVCLLVFELVVYFRGRHFSPPSLEAGVEDSVEYIYAKWLVVRANYLAPMLLSLTNVCIVLFLILSLGRFVSLLGCFCIKLGGLKPVSEMNYKKGAENKGVNAEDYPMVLVQIPMCNEREGVEGDDNGDAKRLKPAESGKNETKTEKEDAKGGSNDESEKQKGNQKPHEPPKDYIHVRARRGQATDSHSLAERVRREKISERMKLLQDLVPGCNKVTGKALMLDEIINYIQSLQRQVEGVEGDDNGDAKHLKPAESGKNETKTEEEDAKVGSNDESKKQKGNQKPREPPKDYIHVRARRGQATDSHSLAERVRREKISERMKLLQDLVPGCNKATGEALMLDEIINYVQSLQRQVEFLTMKFASVNPSLDFNMENLLSKDMFQPNATMPHHMYPLDSSAPAFNHHQPRQNIQQNNANISSWPLSQCPVDPLTLDAPLCGRNLGIELPSVDGFSNSLPQFPAFTEDDPHSIVQMGFVQNPVDFPVQNQTANKKFEQ